MLIDFRIGEQICEICFLVVKGARVPMIIGTDYLTKLNARIDFIGRFVELKGHKYYFQNALPEEEKVSLHLQKELEYEDAMEERDWKGQIDNIATVLKKDEVEESKVDELIQVFKEYRDVFSDSPGVAKNFICTLHMKPGVKLSKRMYPIPTNKAQAVHDELRRMISEDVIEESESPYCSPVVCVSKSDSSVRLCLDAREINQFIIKTSTEPPTVDEILVKFEGCKYLSTFDLTSGYHQVKLDPKSRKYVSFKVWGRVFSYK